MNNDNETIENNEMPEKKKRSKLSTFLGALAALLALALAASVIWIFFEGCFGSQMTRSIFK